MTEPAFLSATRAAYDTVADAYAEHADPAMAAKPLGRAMFAAFAEYVPDGRVLEVGCGPGHITAHLRSLGLDASGIDLSPGMIALARRRFPGVRFDQGTMTALDVPDGTLGGIVAWYSVIHIPSDLLPAVFAEFHRALAPGGQLLLGFQVGDESMHLTEAFGRRISLDVHRLSPDSITELLTAAGFTVTARLVREPDDTEKVPQAHLIARRGV